MTKEGQPKEEAKSQPPASGEPPAGTRDRSSEIQSKEEDYGYVFFTKRDAISTKHEKESHFGKMREIVSFASFWHRRCLKNVVRCTQEDPFVRLMMAALKSRGCEVDLTRHLSCEPCDGPVNGGYDFVNKQVAVCENNSHNRQLVCGVLRHELIHAFDDCRAKINLLDNIDHVACTEIRAANFVHCSFSGAFLQGLIPKTKLSDTHRQCVRAKALGSVLGVRNVSREEAEAAVDRVFERCYADLEPIGVRPKKKRLKEDCRRAFVEAKYYGYRDLDENE